MERKNSNKFWFVWNPHGRSPSFRHESETAARYEAERLARFNPNETFVILESIGDVRMVNTIYTEHKLEVPF